MSIENEVRGRGPMQASVRSALVVALVAAVAATLLAAVGATVAIVGDLTTGRLSSTLATEAAVPDEGGDLVSAVYDSADVVVRDVPAGIVALVEGADVAGVLARLLVGIAFIVMLLAVRRRAPFSRAVALQVTLLGGLAMIGALLDSGLGVLGDWMLERFLTDAGFGTWPMVAAFDPTLIAVGFALMVVGLFLAHGAELQRETDGLV